MFLRRGIRNVSSSLRLFSSQAYPDIKLEDFRTLKTDPSKHTEADIGRIYTVDKELQKSLFQKPMIPLKLHTDVKTFQEMCLMVRSPAVEIIGYLNNMDFTQPVNRFVLYGRLGAGKTSQLLHLLHYGRVNGYIIVHASWPKLWFEHFKESSNSLTKEGMIDINIDAGAWLIRFKAQNEQLLEKLQLKTSKDYVWSPRETTPANSTLLELVDHGISRVKYATEVIAALVEELKQQSTDGKCRTMVAIDGVNSFFEPRTRVKDDNRSYVPASQITMTEPFLSLTRPDWSNGVCILTVDAKAVHTSHRKSDLPKYLLRRAGFEHLDPFVPIHVDQFNDLEFQNMIKYYIDRKFLINFEPGFDEQLKFLTNKNGRQLRQEVLEL